VSDPAVTLTGAPNQLSVIAPVAGPVAGHVVENDATGAVPLPETGGGPIVSGTSTARRRSQKRCGRRPVSD
jgi:hypothetical protein